MCFFLSLIYNRHQQLELMAGQRIDITDRRFGSSSSAATCPDEVESLRLLVKSVSTVLNQVCSVTLELLLIIDGQHSRISFLSDSWRQSVLCTLHIVVPIVRVESNPT